MDEWWAEAAEWEKAALRRYLREAFFGPGAHEDWRDAELHATGEHPT